MGSNKEIEALTDFEHVLLRPQMYISNTEISEEKLPIIRDGKIYSEYREISQGFYKLYDEILSNAFDEAKRQGGNTSRIEIHFNSQDHSVKVVDTGGGFLNGSAINKKTGITNIASAMTLLRAGSNFKNSNTTENLIGTNGVGASIVNMLSDFFSIYTVDDKEVYSQTWNKFIPTDPVIKKRTTENTGTTIYFTPRKDVFKHCKWDREYIHTMMIFRQILKKTDPAISNLDFVVTFDGEPMDLNVAFVPENHYRLDTKLGTLLIWDSFSQSASVTFVNGAICGGIHHRIFIDWMHDILQCQNGYKFFECMIILNLPPKIVRFGDQNKTKLDSSRKELSPLLEKFFFNALKRQFKNSPVYESITKRIAESEKEGDVRSLRNKKRVQKGKISDKYFPPSSKTKNLFIVEGGSAMGSILQKRDPKCDAVYALKGKIRNARRLSDLTSNSEIVDLMNILNLDPENDRACKFEKIIISADADPDGLGHIASLVTNLFYKWFPNVIRQGKLYILQTPLMTGESSRKTRYFYSMKDFETLSKTQKFTNIRYLKGLGSLSKSDWEYVFADMHLLRLAEDSRSSKMMEIAFGLNASLRKKWLQG